jgi:hypothetical protein
MTMQKTISMILIALIAGMGSADVSGVKAGVNYCVNNAQACMNKAAE